MTNREKFKEQLLDIACSGNVIAVNKKTGVPVCCYTISCCECEFNRGETTCRTLTKHWSKSEYVEPPVDWSKVPVDTPILVRDKENVIWCNRYFAKFEDDFVYAWKDGCTSWSADGSYDVTKWRYAKLAEDDAEE